MADERDFIEKAQFWAGGRDGKELSPTRMANEFAKWGADDRLQYLDGIERDLSGAHLSLNEATRIHSYHRGLKSTHERLRRIDR